MGPSNKQVIPAGTSATGTVNSSVIDSSFIFGISFQIVSSSGSNAGSIQIQASNDTLIALGEPLAQNAVPVNWTNVGSAATVAAGASAIASLPQSAYAGYRWLRVQWVPTAGAGTITVTSFAMSY